MPALRRTERVLLGWHRPPLHAAADWLLANAAGPAHDLSGVVVALPGARAGRRLEELLAERARRDWRPPRVVTAGRLSDELVRLARPTASRLARTLAWDEALAGLAPEDREALVLGGRLEPRSRLRLAELVRGLHGELAPEGASFARVARAVPPEEEAEARRWEALARAQEAYRGRLARLGLDDPHEARRAAVERGDVDASRRVVLVGVVELGGLLRAALARVLDAGGAVTALVAAPPELADGFDELGALVPDVWRARPVPIPDERWHVVDRPADQADLALRLVAGFGGRHAAEEIVIGVPDAEVVPYLARRLEERGVRARVAAGTPLGRTRPVRLLEAVRALVERRGFAELAALVRHPDVERALRPVASEEADLASALDAYQCRHLPERLEAPWLESQEAPRARAALEDVARLCGELWSGPPRALAAWAAPIRAALVGVYPHALDPGASEAERVLAGALGALGAALEELEELPSELGRREAGAADALDLVLRQLAGGAVPPAPARPGEPTVELLGWLELPLDDAPAAVVTGFSEGRVPRGAPPHPLLPDALRARLGLACDDDHAARDAWAAAAVARARPDAHFVTGRRTLDGDPLAPSRLALRVPRAELAARVLRFQEPPSSSRVAAPAPAGRAAPAPELPREPLPAGARLPGDVMSVTAFKEWLASPYLFYLRRVLRLEALDEVPRELDPLAFGDLAHAVLAQLGTAEAPRSEDEREIAAFLLERLEELARERYGAERSAAVALQLEQLRHRLRLFAPHEAQRRREGWRIVAVEWVPKRPVQLDVDGRPCELRGRIDRVDRHADGRFALWDYKTSESGGDPVAAHWRARDEAWLDLQLPLYALLAGELGVAADERLVLGYASLGKSEDDVRFRPGEGWPERWPERARTEAERVVREIRAGVLHELGRARVPYERSFRAILGHGVLAAEEAAGAVEAEAPA